MLAAGKRAADGSFCDDVTEKAASIAAANAAAGGATGGAAAAGAAAQTKDCPWCGKPNHVEWKTCNWCDGRLPAKSAVERDAAEAAAAAAAAEAAAADIVNVVIKTRLTRTRLRVRTGRFEDGKMVFDEEAVEADDGSMLGLGNGAALVHIFRDDLPALPYEPVSRENKQRIYDYIGKIACVREFVDDKDVKREWVFIVSDAGAMDRDLLLSDSKYRRLHYIPGGGHTGAVALRTVHFMLQACGADELLTFVYPSRPGTVAYLSRAACLHQTRDWVLGVCHKALCRAAARAYLQSGTHAVVTFAAFKAWLASAAAVDPRMKLLHSLLTLVLPALRLMHVGTRANDAAAYHTGCKAMLPVLHERGCGTYVHLLVDDERLLWLSTPAVRRLRAEFMSTTQGEPVDFDLETLNAELQAIISYPSEAQWLRVSSTLSANRDVRATLLRNLGVHVPGAKGYRTSLNAEADIAQAELFLAVNDSLVPRAGAALRGLSGAAMCAGVELIYEHGTAALKKVADAACARQPYSVPRGRAMRPKEEVEGVQDAVVVHSALTESHAQLARTTAQLEALTEASGGGAGDDDDAGGAAAAAGGSADGDAAVD